MDPITAIKIVGVLFVAILLLWLYYNARDKMLDKIGESVDEDFDEFDDEAFQEYDKWSGEAWDVNESIRYTGCAIIILAVILVILYFMAQ